MKVKAVFFDCDGVLLLGTPWKDFTKAAGIPRELDKKWWDDYYEGRISFEEWMDLERNAYRKAKIDREVLEKIFGPRNEKINTEAIPLVKYLKENKIETAIISSGAEAYVKAAAQHLGIDDYRFNAYFEYDSDGKLYNIASFGSDPEMKDKHIRELCEKLNIDPKDCIFVGDSTNDYMAFQLTGRGIMYGNHPQLAPYAWKQVLDLSDIIQIVEDENRE